MCEFVRRVSVFRLPMEHQCTATYANARGKRLRMELGGKASERNCTTVYEILK